MTRQELFLIDKGYSLTFNDYYWKRHKDYDFYISIKNKYFKLFPLSDFYTQKDIDNLQIAFNNLNRDFEEAMKLED